MRVVAFLPIKLNSQRLPHKNTLELAGHPLCWHLSETLSNVKMIDDVYVYCSDASVVNYCSSKAKFLQREKYLDGNNVKSFELIGSFIKAVDADVYVFANTTSPFLKSETIENALMHVLDNSHDSALTVEKIQTFARFRGEPINYDINDIPKTQDIEPIYIETSGFYIFTKDVFVKNNRRVGFNPYLQVVQGLEAIDIDTLEDFKMAEALYGIKAQK